MSRPEPLDVLRALLDPVRLAVAGASAAGPVPLRELAERLDVRPKAVARAVGDLRTVGLLDAEGALRTDVLRTVAASLPQASGTGGGPVEGPWTPEEAEILGRFFDGDRLVEMPSSHRKRRLVLEKFALGFEPGRRYRERDVDFTIQLVYPDYVTVRRHLVDEGLMDRADGVYWRIGGRFEVPDDADAPPDDVRSVITTGIEGILMKPYDWTMVDDLAATANDPRIPRYMGDQFAAPYTRDDAEAWVEITMRFEPPMQYAVFDGGGLIGGLGGFPAHGEATGSAEIGWWLHPDHWGKGIMSACARALVDELFERGYMRLWAPVMAPNLASARVAERAGLRLEGLAPSAYLKGGVRYDQLSYGITRAQWLTDR